jgi:S-adenosylmethionine:tRNA ribosyltransferase-isomerase
VNAPAMQADELLAPATGRRGDALAERLMVIDPSTGGLSDRRIADLPELLREGDLLVLNDAATLPASLRAIGPMGEPMELRLAHARDDGAWDVALFGDGDWRTRTEHRPAPPAVRVGEALLLGDDLRALVESVSPVSPRLVTVRFSLAGDAFWRRLYQLGRPVQYAHLQGELALWDVQTPVASRPWAMEMPSAARPLSWALLEAGRAVARRRAGDGDPRRGAVVDRATRRSTRGCRGPSGRRCRRRRWTPSGGAGARGGRVVAVGTSVVRALEGAPRGCESGGAALAAGTAVTDLVLGEGFTPRVVDGVLTGMHEPGSSHFALLTAFASAALLRRLAALRVEPGVPPARVRRQRAGAGVSL